MEADNVEEVVEAIEDEFTEYHARYAEDTYETISIVEAADVEQFDIKEYTARALAEEADKKAKQQQARELAELERLKKKYEQ